MIAEFFLELFPAIHYIFFVIANEVKQSLEFFTAITKKDAATIGARDFVC